MADEMPEDKKELTAKQKKNKKKKEAAKRKKQQKQTESHIVKEGEEEIETNNTPEKRFQQELSWCIEHLELGLMTQRPDKKQESHTMHLIKSLKSVKTPLPRKRQIMFSMFGDYRRKMQDLHKEPAQIPVISAMKPAEQKSMFLRTCYNSTKDISTECEELEKLSTSPSWTFAMSDNSFRFGFDECRS